MSTRLHTTISSITNCFNSKSIFLSPVTISELLVVMRNMSENKAYYPEDIHTKIFKNIGPIISEVLVNLINNCFSMGFYPDIFKTAKLTPVYKSGLRSNICNYRPIAISPNINQIMEWLIYNRIVNFLDQNDILSENQSGFRKTKSTETAILQIVTSLKNNMDKSNYSLAIKIDLSKAFDLLDHSLLKKTLYNWY